MNRISDDVIERIIDFYLGDISEREKMDLERWVKETPGQEQCFKQTLKMCQRLRLSSREERAGGMKTRIQEKWREERLKRRRRFVWGVISSAAAVLLLVGIFHVYYTNRKEPVPETLPKISLLESKHGEREAILQFPSGNEVMLGRENDRTVPLAEGIVLKSDSVKNLFPQPESGKDVMTEEYHTVIVPRGGEYDLVLEDGTRVWLNADSRLKYPVVFPGSERRVMLEGEAYFEVARDTNRPFLVETGVQSLRVLGTAFNVCAYPDEPDIYTTLVHGSVALSTGGQGHECVLVPGEQAVCHVHNGSFTVGKVDVSQVAAWKKGLFVFENQNLEQIMLKLARWYNVTVFFRNEAAKTIEFRGNLPKYSNFRSVLQVIEKSSYVKFDVKGKTVTVSI